MWEVSTGKANDIMKPVVIHADRILRRGAKGADVRELQERLAQLGFSPGNIDGSFGKKTEAAVKAYQTSRHLTIDGVAGPETLGKLSQGIQAVGNTSHVISSVENGSPLPQPTLKTLSEIDAHFEKGTVQWYEAAFLICQFDPGEEHHVEVAARRVLKNKPSYQKVEKLRGIPWFVTGVIFDLEASSDMSRYLGNGQKLNHVTTTVPKGRGPFKTWLDGALDAIDIEPIWNVPAWTVGQFLRVTELWNGTGYLRYHHMENSPYDWACTNINDGTGKYLTDGKFNKGADANTQVGSAAILKQLHIWGEVNLKFGSV